MRRTVKVQVGDKAIPASFLKVEGRECSLGRKTEERGGQIEELVDSQNPGPVAPSRSKKGQRRCQERSDVEGWVCQGH